MTEQRSVFSEGTKGDDHLRLFPTGNHIRTESISALALPDPDTMRFSRATLVLRSFARGRHRSTVRVASMLPSLPFDPAQGSFHVGNREPCRTAMKLPSHHPWLRAFSTPIAAHLVHVPRVASDLRGTQGPVRGVALGGATQEHCLDLQQLDDSITAPVQHGPINWG
jgi:hypothetical protein